MIRRIFPGEIFEWPPTVSLAISINLTTARFQANLLEFILVNIYFGRTCGTRITWIRRFYLELGGGKANLASRMHGRVDLGENIFRSIRFTVRTLFNHLGDISNR